MMVVVDDQDTICHRGTSFLMLVSACCQRRWGLSRPTRPRKLRSTGCDMGDASRGKGGPAVRAMCNAARIGLAPVARLGWAAKVTASTMESENPHNPSR